MGVPVIVGAGAAGLSSALALQLASRNPVLVLEKEARLGGLAATLHWNHCLLDLGPHRIYTELREVKEFIDQMLGKQLVTVQRQSRMLLGERYCHYPPRLKEVIRHFGLFTAFGMSLGAAIAAAYGFITKDKSRSYADYLRHRFGGGLTNRLLAPLARKMWKCDLNSLCAEMAAVRISSASFSSLVKGVLTGKSSMALEHFTYPMQGIGQLAEAMGKRLTQGGSVLLNSVEVEKVRVADGRVREVQFRDKEGGAAVDDPQAVLSTIPLQVLLNLIEPEPPEPVLKAAGQLTYLRMKLVYIRYELPQLTPDTWLYFPEADYCFTRVFEVKNFIPALVPGEQTVVCAEVPCGPGQNLSDAETYELVQRDLERAGLGTAEDASACLVVDLPHAYPLYTLDYRANLEVIFKYLSEIENMYSLGRQGLFCYNNLDHSIKLGFLAGKAAAKGTPTPKEWYAQREELLAGYRIVD